jgi:oligoendopeptidase F
MPRMAAGAAAWDLTELYPSDAAWDAARKGALAALPGIAKYKGRLGESAAVLAGAGGPVRSRQDDRRVYTYVSLKGDEDVRVAAYQEKQAQAIDLYTAFGEATAWFAPKS